MLRVPEHVILRAFAAETVLLNLETGVYHGVNETGRRLLALLDETEGSVDDAAAQLAAETGEDPSRVDGDARAFFAALEERGLVVG